MVDRGVFPCTEPPLGGTREQEERVARSAGAGTAPAPAAAAAAAVDAPPPPTDKSILEQVLAAVATVADTEGPQSGTVQAIVRDLQPAVLADCVLESLRFLSPVAPEPGYPGPGLAGLLRILQQLAPPPPPQQSAASGEADGPPRPASRQQSEGLAREGSQGPRTQPPLRPVAPVLPLPPSVAPTQAAIPEGERELLRTAAIRRILATDPGSSVQHLKAGLLARLAAFSPGSPELRAALLGHIAAESAEDREEGAELAISWLYSAAVAEALLRGGRVPCILGRRVDSPRQEP